MRNNQKGEFVRWESKFRNWVTVDGRAGPSGHDGFKAEPHRYHLYVSYACPWAHRTLIYRALKGLETVIPVSIVHPVMPEESWLFGDYPGATPDRLYGYRALWQLYQRAEPAYDGVVTVPILWDSKRETIVNNESSEIIRMLNSAFNEWADNTVDLYPGELRGEIDALNLAIYRAINNGVYRVGFAKSQQAYEEAFDELFEALDSLEERLGRCRYLCGDRLTEADLRLFPTLVRFDAVYVGHFKCNKRRLVDYPNLWDYTRELYQMQKIAETVNLDHIKRHYYASHPFINPTGIVPKGPEIDFMEPTGRALSVSP